MLVGPIFMMQVYDRVLPSGSVETLVGLFLIVILLFGLFGFLDYAKNQLLLSFGESQSEQIAKRAFFNVIIALAKDGRDSPRRSAIEDVFSVRSFLVSPGFAALFDVFWAPIFLVFIFILHPALGVASLCAAAVLILMAILNERSGRTRIETDTQLRRKSMTWIHQVQRQATTVRANGLEQSLADRWFSDEMNSRNSALELVAESSLYTTATKTLRMVMQSFVLALGAYLVIVGELSAGAMIAASIVFARTLAPVEQILSQYANLLRARDAWSRIKSWKDEPSIPSKLVLPSPKHNLKLAIETLTPPGAAVPVLNDVSFELVAGDVLGVIGPSGGGKSSLMKAISGAWAVKGRIELDGADIAEWPRDQLRDHIGYLPQELDLFDGTIAENVSGFRNDATDEDIVAACKNAGAHNLILGLESGYNTQVGSNGIPLSAGQRQRVSLARALYGDPFLIVLDEPNSNLDKQGEAALAAAIRTLKQAKKIIILVAHRSKIMSQVDKICAIEAGRMKMFGDKADLERRLALASDQVMCRNRLNKPEER